MPLTLLLALLHAGDPAQLSCDDALFLPVNEAVDFATDIQPLFENLECTNCHLRCSCRGYGTFGFDCICVYAQKFNFSFIRIGNKSTINDGR